MIFVKEIQSNLQPYDPFAIIEGIYMGWFTFEFIMRLLTCPNKVLHHKIISFLYLLCLQFKFVTKMMNIIDFIAVLPYYISLIFYREDLQY